jgi:hypothetical protein
MNPRASFVLLLAAPIVLAQCSGPSASPIGPSSSVAPGISVSSAGPQDLSDDVSGTWAALAQDLSTLAGDWKGDLILTEQDGDVFRSKFTLTLTALGGGIYQGTASGTTLTLTPNGASGLYTATMATGETRSCDGGTAVVYIGSATSEGKKLAVNVEGLNDDCRLERIEIDLKIK